MLEGIGSADAWIALATLSAMEIVLGIDNIVFITILVGRLPPDKRDNARRLGIAAALISRLGLLFTLSWIMRLTAPLFSIAGRGFSGRDLILIGGGLFLIAKATKEIHHKLEGGGEETDGKSATSAAMVIAQIMVVDIVFSLDSVITAVGMADQLWVMVTAMMLAVGVMLVFARAIGDFVERHPSIKVLGLSFLLLIGVTLVADGLGQHVSKGYIYAAMGFSLFVEMLNMRSTRKKEPVHLRTPYEEAPPAT